MGLDFSNLWLTTPMLILSVLAIVHLLGRFLIKPLSKIDLLGKLFGKKKDAGSVTSAAVLLIFALGVFTVPNNLWGVLGGTNTASVTGNNNPATTVGQNGCPSTGLIEVDARGVDRASTTLAYANSSTFYVKGNVFKSGTTQSTAPGYDGNVSVPCADAYSIYLLTQRGTYSSSKELTLNPTSANPQVSFDVKGLSTLQFYVQDNTAANTYLYIFNNGVTTGTNSSGSYVTNMNASNGYALANASDIQLSTDGYIDETIYLKTTTANKVFGEDGLRVWMCVDIGSNSQYQEPSVSVNGQKLTDGKSTMFSDDLTVSQIAGSEYCYSIPQVKDTPTQISFYLKARSGVNPSDDPVVYFLPEGRYLSSKVADTVKVGAYTDAATPALVGYDSSAYYPYFTIKVS